MTEPTNEHPEVTPEAKAAVEAFIAPSLSNLDVIRAADALDKAIKLIDALEPLQSPRQKTATTEEHLHQFHIPYLYLARVRAEEARMYLDRFHNSRHLTWTFEIKTRDDLWRKVSEPQADAPPPVEPAPPSEPTA